MKHLRSIFAAALALALSSGVALAQSGQGSSPLTIAKGGTNATTASGARSSLGLTIGSAVQAWDADLDALAALGGTNTIYYRSAANTWTAVTIGGMLSFSGGTLNVGDAELAAIAGLTSAADKCFYFTGSGTAATFDCPSWARSVISAANASAGRTAFGLAIGSDVQAYDAELAALAGLTSANNKCFYWTGAGTAATFDCSSYGRGLINAADASAARTSLGAVIGTDVQAYNARLAAIAGYAATANRFFGSDGSGNATLITLPAAGLALSGGSLSLANDLAALEGLSSTGFATRTTTDTWAQRTMTGTTNEVCVTNGDGVSGNPTFGICSDWLSTAHTWAGVQTFAAPIATGAFDIQGTLKLSAFVTSTQITSNQNNYTATDGSNTCSTKTTLRISTDASRNITGLSCGQAEGDLRIIHNVGAQAAVLTNQDTNSTAANRFLFGGDVTLSADTSITLRYDGATSRWRALTSPGAGGGGGGVTNVTIAAGANISVSGTCSITTSGTCTVAGSAPLEDFRNILVANGGFEIWQRGAGVSASISVAASTTAYTADRWYIATGANQAYTVSAQAGLVNQSRLSARIQRNSGQTGTGTVRVAYPLETAECVRLRGQNITLQFYYSTGGNWSPSSGALTYTFYTGTGSEGKRSGSAYTSEATPLTSSSNLATGSSATQVTFTGASTVSASVTQCEIQFSWAPTGTASANDWIQLDDVQLEAGSSATAFERPSDGLQLRESQRHYVKSFPYGVAPAQNAGLTGALSTATLGATTSGILSWRFPIQMRATPSSVTTYNPSAANSSWRLGASDISAAVSNSSADGTTIYCSSTPPSNGIAYIHAGVDASL